MVLGARPASATAMGLKSGLTIADAGVVLGIVAAAGGWRLLRAALDWVETPDLVMGAAIVILLAGGVLIGGWLPARRASRVAPSGILNSD